MDRAKAASHRASLCGSISALGPSVSSSVKGGKGLFSEVSSNSGVGDRLWEPLVGEGGWEGTCTRGFEQGGMYLRSG